MIFLCLSRNVNYVTMVMTTLYKSGKNMQKPTYSEAKDRFRGRFTESFKDLKFN